MKKAILVCLINLAVLAVGGISAHAQNFAVDWFTIAGGGGTSTGGAYSVSATVGQPAAGMLSGGDFSVSGGFWSIAETPPAPRLTIKLSSSNTAVVSWPSPSTGWNLQQNATVNTTGWVAPSEVVADDGTNKSITVNRPAGNRFYRLFKP